MPYMSIPKHLWVDVSQTEKKNAWHWQVQEIHGIDDLMKKKLLPKNKNQFSAYIQPVWLQCNIWHRLNQTQFIFVTQIFGIQNIY